MTQRDRIVLGVLATAAVLGGFWMLLLAPRRDEASKLSEQVAEAQGRVDTARGRLQTAELAKQNYGKQVLTMARLGKAVPPTDDVPSLVVQLERTARAAGIDFRAVTVDAVAPQAGAAAGAAAGTAGVKPMPFSLTFEGDFLELRKFLAQVHSLTVPRTTTLDVKGRLLTIETVNLVPGPAGLPEVTAQIKATAYTAPVENPAAAAVAAATPQGGATPTPNGTAVGGQTAQSNTGGSTPPTAIVGGLLP